MRHSGGRGQVCDGGGGAGCSRVSAQVCVVACVLPAALMFSGWWCYVSGAAAGDRSIHANLFSNVLLMIVFRVMTVLLSVPMCFA